MPQTSQNYCTYSLKSLSLAFAIAGIICSWVASKTCDFISFYDGDNDPPDDAEDAPFNMAIAANVGIYRYEVTKIVNGGGTTGCIPYDDRWAHQSAYPSIATAQFCALFAPLIATIGIFAGLMDFCVCNFPGSAMISALLFVAASGIQAGTFTLVADPVFCFEDSDLDCSHGRGVYLSAVATIFFFVASCLVCCAPWSDPFCVNFGREKTTPVKKEAAPEKTVVMQPIIIQTPSPQEEKDKKNYRNNNNNNKNNNNNNKTRKTRKDKKMSNKV